MLSQRVSNFLEYAVSCKRFVLHVYAPAFSTFSSSVADPDPCGSVLKCLPRIRIRIGNTGSDQDPGQVKSRPKREKIRDFKLQKEITILLKV